MIKNIAEHEFNMFVLNSKKSLVLVDFWAPWCKPCQVMEPILEAISRRYTQLIDVVKVNIDDEDRLAKVSGIRSVPTIIFFKNGQPLRDRILIGTQSESSLIGHIEELLR